MLRAMCSKAWVRTPRLGETRRSQTGTVDKKDGRKVRCAKQDKR